MRLHKEQRDQLPVMLDFAREIERQLESTRFDECDPSMEPSLYEARRHASRLSAFLDDMNYLCGLEHTRRRQS